MCVNWLISFANLMAKAINAKGQSMSVNCLDPRLSKWDEPSVWPNGCNWPNCEGMKRRDETWSMDWSHFE